MRRGWRRSFGWEMAGRNDKAPILEERTGASSLLLDELFGSKWNLMALFGSIFLDFFL